MAIVVSLLLIKQRCRHYSVTAVFVSSQQKHRISFQEFTNFYRESQWVRQYIKMSASAWFHLYFLSSFHELPLFIYNPKQFHLQSPHDLKFGEEFWILSFEWYDQLHALCSFDSSVHSCAWTQHNQVIRSSLPIEKCERNSFNIITTDFFLSDNVNLQLKFPWEKQKFPHKFNDYKCQ